MASHAFEESEHVGVAPPASEEHDSARPDPNAPLDPDLLRLYSYRHKLWQMSKTLIRKDWRALKEDNNIRTEIKTEIAETIDNLRGLLTHPIGKKVDLHTALHDLNTAHDALVLAGDLAIYRDLREQEQFYTNIALCRHALNLAAKELSSAED